MVINIKIKEKEAKTIENVSFLVNYLHTEVYISNKIPKNKLSRFPSKTLRIKIFSREDAVISIFFLFNLTKKQDIKNFNINRSMTMYIE